MSKKNEYILKQLSKAGGGKSRKRWELFVVSRVIHRLNDETIEFVTQQLVRRAPGRYALTDLYFPQFNCHLEVDEGHHQLDEISERDKKRAWDIKTITKGNVFRIRCTKRIRGRVVEQPVSEICQQVDRFVERIRGFKERESRRGRFTPWDFERSFSPERHLDAGYIDRDETVTFHRQRDALRCFGFEGKFMRRGAWRVPYSADVVWFPRLYANNGWDNEMSPDRKVIWERALSKDAKARADRDRETLRYDRGNRIVFARDKDPFGLDVYRYIGTFRRDPRGSRRGREPRPSTARFVLERTREDLPTRTSRSPVQRRVTPVHSRRRY